MTACLEKKKKERKKEGENYEREIAGHEQTWDTFIYTGSHLKKEDVLLSECYHFLGFVIQELFLYQEKVSS